MAETRNKQAFCLLCNLLAKEPGRNRAGARHNVGCPKRPAKPAQAEDGGAQVIADDVRRVGVKP